MPVLCLLNHNYEWQTHTMQLLCVQFIHAIGDNLKYNFKALNSIIQKFLVEWVAHLVVWLKSEQWWQTDLSSVFLKIFSNNLLPII